MKTKVGHWMLAAVVTAVTSSGVAAHAGTIVTTTKIDSLKALTEESTLGDFVADSIRSAATGAQFAFVDGDELRPVSIDPGTVSTDTIVGVLRSAQQASDTIVLLKLTGSQLRSALERGLSRSPSPYAGFLQISGLKVVYDPSLPDRSRIVSLVASDGSPIVADASYSVATTQLLGDGGLGYFECWSKDNVVRNTQIPLDKAVTDYVVAHQPLSLVSEGRITSK